MNWSERIGRRTFFKIAALGAVNAALCKTESPPLLSPEEIKKLKEFDVLLFFCPGGLGYTPLEKDPKWKELLEKTQDELENQGYKTKILEELRQKSLFSIFSVEQTTKKIRQLTSLTNLKIILTGRSSGALFIENVLRTLPDNDRILAIEVARPWGTKIASFSPERTLLIENPNDPWQKGDLGEVFKTASLGRGGALLVPEHENGYAWDQVSGLIKNFLNIHFPQKK